jgi:SAM-dependent methyltransferase
MLLPDEGPFEAIRVLWNGEEGGLVLPVPRPDVARVLSRMPDAEDSGFSARVPAPEDATGCVELVGFSGGRARARLGTYVRPPALDSTPLPPTELAERVSATSGTVFRTQGLKGFTDLVEQLDRHADRPRAARLLDWGCGCGRFTRHFIDAGFADVSGCDIDAEAVEWCARNLAPASFTLSSPDPPLPYEGASMDIVIGCSVFTHLSREAQTRWLDELRRILAPGGLLLASVHGEFTFARVQQARARSPAGAIGTRLRRMRRREALARDGIVDADLDRRLDDVAPRGYYRATYQTRDYTVREWSSRFEVLDYVERGLLGHQDLVVLRRPPS